MAHFFYYNSFVILMFTTLSKKHMHIYKTLWSISPLWIECFGWFLCAGEVWLLDIEDYAY